MTVAQYDNNTNPIRSDIGYAVWVLQYTYGSIVGLPCNFRKEWKERLTTLLK